MCPATDEALISMSDLADLAGVSRPTVSNWRRRFDDFPEPAVRGPGGRDRFRLYEVNEWLTSHDRPRIRPSTSDALWFEALAAVRGEMSTAEAIECACALLAIRRLAADHGQDFLQTWDSMLQANDPPGYVASLLGPDATASTIEAFLSIGEPRQRDVGALVRVASDVEPADTGDVIESLLERWRSADAYGRTAESSSSPSLLALLSAIARPAPGDLIYDPAAGEAGLLIRIASQAGQDVDIAGQEINSSAWRLSVFRAVAHGLDPSRLTFGDTLLDDQQPGLRAALVVSDPPYGTKDWGAQHGAVDAVMQFGLPSRKYADFAWLQHAIAHLSRHGRAYVVLPPASTFRSGPDARIRRELLRRGCVEAIIGLPAGLADNTSIPLVVWVVTAADTADQSGRVLIIDASAAGEPATGRARRRTLDAAVIDAIDRALTQARTDGVAFDDLPGFAVGVPVAELLDDHEVTVDPGRWVHAPTPDAEGIAEAVNLASNSLAATIREMQSLTPPLVSARPAAVGAPRIRISELVDEGYVQVLVASRISSDHYTDQGTPLITQRALKPVTREVIPDRCVNLNELSGRPVITRAGDVILATVGDSPFAVVCPINGAVLGGALEILRIEVQWLDPHVVAGLLSGASTARAAKGTAMKRVRLRDLELPTLTPSQTTTLAGVFDDLRRIAQIAVRGARAAADLRQELIDGIDSSAIEMLDE